MFIVRGMDASSWLLFIYQLPASPSTHRAYVWRKLKSLGALYLQNSICLLPVEASIEKKLVELRSEIAGRGGEAKILHISMNEQG
ncbi:MAG TPA: Chromate resistance protein ChrB, partial [Rectinemataceae bacterium]|nr:Chromate resistance protein ChrB [Rectinemataceae bacterium]